MSPPVTLSVTAKTQKVFVTGTVEIGQQYYWGGQIIVQTCYRLAGSTGAPTPFDDESASPVAINGALESVSSGSIMPLSREGLQPWTALATGSYDFGVCGKQETGPTGAYTIVGWSKTVAMLLQ
jgi:hypothetical protein